MCFSLKNRDTFESIDDIWLPQIKKEQPNVPIILVGTQNDCNDSSPIVVKPDEARKLVDKNRDVDQYLETTVEDQLSIDKVFTQGVIIAIGLENLRPPSESVICGNNNNENATFYDECEKDKMIVKNNNYKKRKRSFLFRCLSCKKS